MHKKLNLFLPNLKFINYHAKKDGPKNIDRDDPAKKADIHKLLPYSKLGQLNSEQNYNTQPSNSNKEENKKKIFPYITEPNLPSNSQIPKNMPHHIPNFQFFPIFDRCQSNKYLQLEYYSLILLNFHILY